MLRAVSQPTPPSLHFTSTRIVSDAGFRVMLEYAIPPLPSYVVSCGIGIRTLQFATPQSDTMIRLHLS
jgi:hypothetical protein